MEYNIKQQCTSACHFHSKTLNKVCEESEKRVVLYNSILQSTLESVILLESFGLWEFGKQSVVLACTLLPCHGHPVEQFDVSVHHL